MRNLHQLFDWQYIGQRIDGDFSKFCGLLRIYELYSLYTESTKWMEEKMNFQVPTEGLELVILLHTQY